MKRRSDYFVFCLIVTLATVTMILSTPCHTSAISITFEPLNQMVPVGSPAVVDLVVSDLGSSTAPSLGTFDLDILFDPTILAFNSVTFGDPVLGDQLDLWGLGSITGFDAPTPGMLNLYEISLDSPWDLEDFQLDSFVLATLTFDTLAIGTSTLDISINGLGDAWGDPLTADDHYSGSVNATGTAPVPEPATIFWVGSGLVGICVLRRRKII